MRNKIKTISAIVISMAVVLFFTFINDDVTRAASTVSVSATSVDLYFMDDSYVSTLGNIPSNYSQSFRINATGSSYGYYYYTQSGYISISDDGVITPKKSGVTNLTTGTVQYRYYEADSIVKVYARTEYGVDYSSYTEITVHTHDYSTIAFENACRNIVSGIVTSSMTVEQKTNAITAYVAENYAYNASYSGALSCYIYGGADCWGCNSFIVKLAQAAGLEAWTRNANMDSGAGFGHMNAVIFDSTNNKYYICDAGYDEPVPRYYRVYSKVDPYTYYLDNGEAILTSYYGNPYATSIVIPSSVDGHTVVGLGPSFSNSNVVENITLPNTLKVINDYAFYWNQNLKSINIPASVTYIGSSVFAYDCKLNNLTVASGNTTYTSVDNVIYTKDMKTLVCAPSCSSITIPSTVTTIAPNAFYYNSNITNITFPSSVTTVGNGAFSTCTRLRTVTFESSNMQSVGSGVFRDCSFLRKITFYGNVANMDVNTFAEFRGNIAYGGNVAPAISGAISITRDVTLYSSVTLNDNWTNDKLTIIYTADPIGTMNSTLQAAAGWEAVNNGYITRWKYMLEDGNYASGWECIGGKWYYFGSNNWMATGWMTIDGAKYYFGQNGNMAIGWKEINYNNWYYFGTTGKMTVGWANINGSWYYFDQNGKMQTLWQEIDGQSYYFNDSGKMASGWTFMDGEWYYFKASGSLAKYWTLIDGKWYYFNASGIMQKLWQKIDGKWYYFSSSGAMCTGWQCIDGVWYYFASSGSMTTGWKQIEGKWYYFNSNGKLITGWLKIDGKWYYFKNSGAMATQWLQIDGKWYYFYDSGAMASNTVIEGCTLGSDGAWVL